MNMNLRYIHSAIFFLLLVDYTESAELLKVAGDIGKGIVQAARAIDESGILKTRHHERRGDIFGNHGHCHHHRDSNVVDLIFGHDYYTWSGHRRHEPGVIDLASAAYGLTSRPEAREDFDERNIWFQFNTFKFNEVPIDDPEPTTFEWASGRGNWLKAGKLLNYIKDLSKPEEEFAQKKFYFATKSEILECVRECMLNRRIITLDNLINSHGSFIPEYKSALISWFFYELSGPFDQSAYDMANMLLRHELDINASYEGKVALNSTLYNFNPAAFEWVLQHGGKLDLSGRSQFIRTGALTNSPMDQEIGTIFQSIFEKYPEVSSHVKLEASGKYFVFTK